MARDHSGSDQPFCRGELRRAMAPCRDRNRGRSAPRLRRGTDRASLSLMCLPRTVPKALQGDYRRICPTSDIPVEAVRHHASFEMLADKHCSARSACNARHLTQIKQPRRALLFSTSQPSNALAAPSLGVRCRLLGTLHLKCTNAGRCREGEARGQPRHLRLKRKRGNSRARDSTKG